MKTADSAQPLLHFDGKTYEPEKDQSRLSTQLTDVFALMSHGQYRTLQEIAYVLSYPEASISARLRDLRKIRFGGHTINRRRRGQDKRGHFEYQLIINQTEKE